MTDSTAGPALHVVLLEPEIPQNTGAIGRLCAATGAVLHLAGRLGFSLDDRYLRRARLDYWSHVDVVLHAGLEEALAAAAPERVFYLSARAGRSYTACRFRAGDYLVFGRESTGLPPDLLAREPERTFAIPISGPVRSINLACAVSVVVYEALRQMGRA